MSKKKQTEKYLSEKFICSKCNHKGASVDRLAMGDDSWGSMFNAQTHRYAFIACENCGFTEVYALDVLEGKDNLGAFLEWMFP